jgi:hypothetical protein
MAARSSTASPRRSARSSGDQPVTILRQPTSVIRNLLIVLVVLVAVAATFAASVFMLSLQSGKPLLLAWWPGLLPGAVTVVALGAWWLWWRLPKRQVDQLWHPVSDPKGWVDVEDDFRKTIGQTGMRR